MAWDTREEPYNELFGFFSFYKTFGADGVMEESITGGGSGEIEGFILKSIRIHCSVAFASVEDFIVKLSDGIQGSSFNQTFISQAMNGITDYEYYPTDSMRFISGDELGFVMSLVSGTNIIGLNVQGWAVKGT